MQYAKAVDGVRIAFGTAGSGPALVRVPSLPFSHSQMEWQQGSDFFDQLAANWSVVQYDPRGVGLSDREVADLSLEARISDLEAVVDRLGLETFALHAIGWSGPAVVTYAVRNPERVSHLILDDVQMRIEDFFAIPQIRALDQLRGDWESFLEFLVFTIYGVGRDQSAPFVQYLKACVSQEGAQRIFDAVRGDDAVALLPQVQAPTLILQHSGTNQKMDGAREMAANIPNARLVIINGGVQDDTDRIFHEIADLMETDATAPHKHSETKLPAGGVRAILFTDVVEHTSMMRRLGDEKGREVLRDHERITRDVLRAHAGDEVKTMGDGFLASFGSVARSVEAAIALQRAFAERNESASESIHVRVGLNAGEPIEEDGDLFGSTIILAARLAAAAESAEILASMAVRELSAGKPFLFADRGDRALRGFEDPVRVFEVNWRG